MFEVKLSTIGSGSLYFLFCFFVPTRQYLPPPPEKNLFLGNCKRSMVRIVPCACARDGREKDCHTPAVVCTRPTTVEHMRCSIVRYLVLCFKHKTLEKRHAVLPHEQCSGIDIKYLVTFDGKTMGICYLYAVPRLLRVFFFFACPCYGDHHNQL